MRHTYKIIWYISQNKFFIIISILSRLHFKLYIILYISISTISDYKVNGDSSSSSYRNNLRISTQSPTFQNPIILPPTNLNLGQWYNANIAPLSFWRARLTVQQSSQNYEMNLTFVGSSSPMGVNEKVRC